MPHVIYLHSALTQGRVIGRSPDEQRKLFRFELIDVILAMSIAGAINAAMLLMAASTFFRRGLHEVGSIEQAYQTLEPLLGSASSTIFGISLLAAGLSSSAVGTMAGQVVMQGFLHFHIPIVLRRLITMLPALIVIMLGLDPTRTLVLSQVVLSFGIPFALVPLIVFTKDARLMGVLVNHKITTVAITAVAALIIGLNFFLLGDIFFG
jgi:manganese transport protein